MKKISLLLMVLLCLVIWTSSAPCQTPLRGSWGGMIGGGSASILLKTGQTTSYVTGDDGNLQKGAVQSFTVLTTGQFANTTNIDLTHLVSTHIAFVKGTPNDSITSDTTNFTTLFVAGDVLVFSGSSASGNNTNRTIAAGGVASGTITLTSDNQQTSVAEGDSITIKKREAHSNNCVLDNNTGLMWSRTVSGKMGPLSNGTLPWTTASGGYGIFTYCAAANAASLGGYADWRVPNFNELMSIFVIGSTGSYPDTTAFPAFGGQCNWSSTSTPAAYSTDYALVVAGGSYIFTMAYIKTEYNTDNPLKVILVRGG